MDFISDTIVRTPYSGMVHIEDVAPITAHPHFQRLKRMRQTGLVYTVYPGATHTRYEHSLDTFQTTRNIAVKSLNVGINLSPAELSLLFILALIHDVSHGPYSHQSEFILQQYTGKTHDDLFMSTVEQHFKNTIKKFSLQDLEKVYRSPVFEIINAVHGTDKLSYMRGDRAHIFGELMDIEPLLTWSAYSPENGFCINEEGVQSLRTYLEEWYQMHNDAYGQKAVLANYTLLHRAMDTLVKDGVIELSQLMGMTDDEVNNAILSHPTASTLLRRIFDGPDYWYKPIVTFKMEGHESNEVKERGKGIEIVPVNRGQASGLSEIKNNHDMTEIERELFEKFAILSGTGVHR